MPPCPAIRLSPVLLNSLVARVVQPEDREVERWSKRFRVSPQACRFGCSLVGFAAPRHGICTAPVNLPILAAGKGQGAANKMPPEPHHQKPFLKFKADHSTHTTAHHTARPQQHAHSTTTARPQHAPKEVPRGLGFDSNKAAPSEVGGASRWKLFFSRPLVLCAWESLSPIRCLLHRTGVHFHPGIPENRPGSNQFYF